MAQQMVSKHQRHHRFAHRNRANADTRVMSALSDNIDLMAINIDRFARR